MMFLKWLGTATGIAGATLRMRENSLALLQAAFTVINVLGIYRWLVV